MSDAPLTADLRASVSVKDVTDEGRALRYLVLIQWAYRVSEEALFRRDTKTDRENRDRALSEINARFKEFA